MYRVYIVNVMTFIAVHSDTHGWPVVNDPAVLVGEYDNESDANRAANEAVLEASRTDFWLNG